MTGTRTSGILLHPSSLPGALPHGDFGPTAYRFVDWLVEAGQHLWQVLPLTPPGSGNSPYMSASAFAGNPAFVSPERLVEQGLLNPQVAAAALAAVMPVTRVDFDADARIRGRLLRQAASCLFEGGGTDRALTDDFSHWCEQNRSWADDYALFAAIAASGLGPAWRNWPAALRHRDPRALSEARVRHADEIRFQLFVQWQFDLQWRAIKRYANDRSVSIVGDIPIYCAFDSADVWQCPELFQLDDEFAPRAVAGVPPDYFSATGQLWGNPLYDWDRHRSDDFAWWRARLRRTLEHADIVRIDHFRGLAGYWAVPAEAATAIDGRWQAGPGIALFDALRQDLGTVPVIAEDLGTITPDVIALRDAVGLPGMAVLQFAFGDDADNLYLPHNLRPNTVLYSGTHDNDTSRGWFASAPAEERSRVQIYLKTDGREIEWDLIHAASSSVARLAIYPMQDVLGLGNESRMNLPGVAQAQWSWRMHWDQLQAWHTRRLAEISAAHGRHPPRTIGDR
ncbi:MAG: 4-alpha-glucanotransferase [Burkholderiaceae bacterium]